jgi:hypothetical protein
VRRCALAMLLSGLALACPPAAFAHQAGTTGFADIRVEGQTVRVSLSLSQVPSGPLADQMGFGEPGVTPRYDLLAQAIAADVHVSNDGADCEPGPRHVVPPTAAVLSLTGTVDFACPGTIGALGIRNDLFDVLGTDVHILARIAWPGGVQQFAFAPDLRTVQIVVAEKAEVGAGTGSFFKLGVEHILTGYDHLLFLIALILCGGGLVSLLKIVTGFTVAHSATLALAALHVVNLPGRLVDAAIALSIAYVAAENLLPRYAVSRRWAVSFVFGAVHGFGFASVLEQLGLNRDNLLLSLLNFNLGVEAGQAAVVLVAVPILLWLRRTQLEPKFAVIFSSAVLVVGLSLFVERTFLWP